MYDGHGWTSCGVEAFRFMFGQYLATGSLLFISRSYQVSGVRLKTVNTEGVLIEWGSIDDEFRRVRSQ